MHATSALGAQHLVARRALSTLPMLVFGSSATTRISRGSL